MCLTITEQQQFIHLTTQYFWQSANLYLLGSRVDDNKKGGDIDLLVETDAAVSMQQKLDFLVNVEMTGTQRKIDLILKAPDSGERAIYKTAKQTGILLC